MEIYYKLTNNNVKLTWGSCKFTVFPRESVILNLNLFSDLFETSIQSLIKWGGGI